MSQCWARPCAVLLLGFMLIAPRAHADSATETEARKLFREGVALHNDHDYSGALKKFREAYRLWKNPKILANIGTEAWELGNYPLAANSYERFLAQAAPDAPERPEVDKALKEVLPKVGTLRLKLSGAPHSVTIDGQPVDPKKSVVRVHLTPGRHRVEAVAESGSNAGQSVKLTAGSTVTVLLSLETAKTDKPAFALEETPSEPDAEPARGHSILPWVVGGVGVASLATSVVLYSLRNKEETALKSECFNTVCPASSSDKIDRANRLGALSAVFFGVGVAGVGVATYLFVKPAGQEPAPQAQAFELRVGASPTAASVSFGRQF